MKYSKTTIGSLLLLLMLTALCASCSNKGVSMPKHRMRRHCNCPTFSQAHISYQAPLTLSYYDE